MLLKNLNLKSSYESGEDNLVQDFYVPALECAVTYDRIAGFFSSSSLAIAAKGIASLIINEGRMRLLASPRLSKEDVEIIDKATKTSNKFFEQKLLNSIDSICDEFEKDHLQALGWMLSNGYLEIQLVFPIDSDGRITENSQLFHQKIGIITDSNGDSISFSGSINESASGWISNIEEFKVFKEWIPAQKEFYETDQNRFWSFWNSEKKYVRVIDLPTSINEKLISYGPDFSKEEFIAKHYVKKNVKKEKTVDENLSLFSYQKKALDMWIENGGSLLIEMATGTGKTRTALSCVNYLMKKHNKLLVVISCPEATLARQWEANEVTPAGFKFDKTVIVDGTNRKWREQLPSVINQLATDYIDKLIVYTTHSSSSGKDFIEIIGSCPEAIPICFVGDEAHGLGASKNKLALLERYNYRVGLSATPERWFDDIGTQVLRKFFGNKSFEFSIYDALTTINPLTKKTFLVNYYYHPIFVHLKEHELVQYMKLSNRIKRLARYKQDDDEYQKRMENLLFQRANIQKSADEKLEALQILLESLGNEAEKMLIFVSPDQLQKVMKLLHDLHIPAHKFTEEEGTQKCEKYDGLSEREYLVHHFKKGTYKALVAISCLDEGIDIPIADKAILMANSTNPREYIQRIGRVIRQANNKGNAHIYDFIVSPSEESILSNELKVFEKDVFTKELVRVSEMAENAINNAEIQYSIDQMK